MEGYSSDDFDAEPAPTPKTPRTPSSTRQGSERLI
jgi:hypothetical protein